MTASTFTQLWEELKTDALNAWQHVQSEVLVIERNLVPVIEQDLILVFSQVKTTAINMILTLATQEFQNLTGGQKNTITVQTVLAAAKTAGKELALQDAQLIVQQSYNALVTTLAPGK